MRRRTERGRGGGGGPGLGCLRLHFISSVLKTGYFSNCYSSKVNIFSNRVLFTLQFFRMVTRDVTQFNKKKKVEKKLSIRIIR